MGRFIVPIMHTKLTKRRRRNLAPLVEPKTKILNKITIAASLATPKAVSTDVGD
jgi:hypothetical protein